MKKVILILIATLGLALGSFAQKGDFSNPALIYGSDFGNYFKVLYTQGKFKDMVKFTSVESIKKHGEKKILEFYKNKFKFGYELGKLKSSYKEDGITVLNYPDARIIATKRTIRIHIIVENDSCKLVLPDKLDDLLK